MTPIHGRHKDQIPLRSLCAFNLMSRSAFERHHALCPFHQIIYGMCSAYTENCWTNERRPRLHSSPSITHTTFTFEKHGSSRWLLSAYYCFLDTHYLPCSCFMEVTIHQHIKKCSSEPYELYEGTNNTPGDTCQLHIIIAEKSTPLNIPQKSVQCSCTTSKSG